MMQKYIIYQFFTAFLFEQLQISYSLFYENFLDYINSLYQCFNLKNNLLILRPTEKREITLVALSVVEKQYSVSTNNPWLIIISNLIEIIIRDFNKSFKVCFLYTTLHWNSLDFAKCQTYTYLQIPKVYTNSATENRSHVYLHLTKK